MSVAVVVGLGNPGPTYVRTRHNLGFRVVQCLAEQAGARWQADPRTRNLVASATVAGRSVVLLQPQTFMNASGEAVGAWLRYHKLPASVVLVIYDEVALNCGQLKVSQQGSAGGHNGVASLLQHVGEGFLRLRLGIGPKAPPELDLAEFVLGPFRPDEEALIAQRLPDFAAAAALIVRDGPALAMNALHRPPRPPKPATPPAV